MGGPSLQRVRLSAISAHFRQDLTSVCRAMKNVLLVCLILMLGVKSEAVQLDSCDKRSSDTYDYFICNFKMKFDDNRELCNSSFNADLVMYPNEDEFNFVRNTLRNYSSATGLTEYNYWIGIYQARGNNPLVAYSGDFYWVTEPNVKITPNSTSYWKPLQQWITNFTSLSISGKSMRTFTLSNEGQQLSGDVFNTGFPTNSSVLCQRIHIPQTSSAASNADLLMRESLFIGSSSTPQEPDLTDMMLDNLTRSSQSQLESTKGVAFVDSLAANMTRSLQSQPKSITGVAFVDSPAANMTKSLESMLTTTTGAAELVGLTLTVQARKTVSLAIPFGPLGLLDLLIVASIMHI